MNRPTAIIPAAGASSRIGRPKPLLPWDDGTLLAYVLEQCRLAGFEERIVVVGAERAGVEAEARAGGAVIAVNEGWQEGRASSIRAGADAAPDAAEPILVLSVDHPRPAWLLQQLLAAYTARPAEVLTPTHAGRRGHPALFAGALLPELRDVRDEDLGLRALIDRHEAGIHEIAVASALIHLDLNTPDVYERALQAYRTGAWAAPIAAEKEYGMQAGMGSYEVPSNVEMPECGIRIIGMSETEAVAQHYHEHSAQVYVVLRGEVEIRVGDHRTLLRPYETLRVPPKTPHSVRPAGREARVLSLSIPPLSREDNHVIDEPPH